MMTDFNILYFNNPCCLEGKAFRVFNCDIFVSGERAAAGLHLPAEAGGIRPDVRHGVCDPVCWAIDEGHI